MNKQLEPQQPKSAAKSGTIWVALALILMDAIPQLQEVLLQYYPDQMKGWGLALIGIVMVILRFKTKGPLSGAAGAIGFGVNYTTDKAIGGLKRGLNVLPGVNLK